MKYLKYCLASEEGFILGGCATVAGWGHRFNRRKADDVESSCMTDYSSLGPAKNVWVMIHLGSWNNYGKD